MNILKSVALGYAVHYRMFSWRTACGKVFDAGEKEVSDEQVTCKVCLRSRVYDYEHLDEYGPYGVGVVDESRESVEMAARYGATDNEMHLYTIRMFHPFNPGEEVSIMATLPNIDMARRLGEMAAFWRHKELERSETELEPVP